MTVLTNEQAINKLQDMLEQYWKLDKKGFVMDFDTAEAIKMGVQALDNQRSKLGKICSMLDELEDKPKAKWIKTSLSYYDDDYGYECSNCKEIDCTDYDFEEMAYNYCPNCGARMNDEVDDESKD